MKLHDPGHVLLRRACRVAVMQPLTYAFVSEVLHQPVSAPYAAFGVFTLLVFADFGGPQRDRALAYLIFGVLGVALVAVGSLLASSIPIAVAFAAVITFAIIFAGVLRGYVAASSSALLLPLMLAMTAAPDLAQTGLRCLGWAIGVIAATVGALVLWPSYEVSALRMRMAAALSAVADAVKQKWVTAPPDIDATTASIHAVDSANGALRDVYDGALLRPAAATARDRSMMSAVSELNRLVTLIKWTSHDLGTQATGALDETNRELALAVAQTLTGSSAALLGADLPPKSLELDQSRARHERASEVWIAQKFKDRETATVLPTLDAAFRLRMAAWSAQALAVYVAGAIRERTAANATLLIEGKPTPVPPIKSAPIVSRLRSQMTFSSPWFRTSVRSAIAVSVSVLLVLLLGIDHGFWIVIGTLTALRFDASGTRGRAVSMLIGTIGGFLISLGLVTLVGSDRLLLFALLPIAVFLAAYTPDAISFALGQGAFTVFAVVLFALESPSRFDTAEYRLLDISVAVAVSLVVSVLLWPRGVAQLVQDRLDTALTATSAYFVMSYRRFTEGPSVDPALAASRDNAVTACRLTSETFDLAVSQRKHETSDVALWRTVINISEHLVYAGDIIALHARMNPRETGGDEQSKRALRVEAEDIQQRMLTSMRAKEPLESPLASGGIDHLRAAVAECIAGWLGRQDSAIGGDVASLVWAQNWLVHADSLSERISGAVAANR